MTSLPTDIIVKVYEYLWFEDVRTYITLTKDKQTGEKMIHFLLNACLSKLKSPFTHMNSREFSSDPIRHNILHFVSKLPPWPSRLVTVEDSLLIDFERDDQIFYRFTGNHLGGNAAVIGDNYFPILPQENSATLPLPFSKLVVNPQNPAQPIMTMSRVAYFEVTIHEPELPPVVSSSGNREQLQYDSFPSCIAVGLASSRFPLSGRMPGWDVYSFGYHGDDGFFYHDHMESEKFDLKKTFGPHDTIGCGLSYPLEYGQSGNIFFTVNGVFVKSFHLHYDYFTIEWYPAIGIDSFSPVTVNFGGNDRPFMYKEVEMTMTPFDEKDYFGQTQVYNPYFYTPYIRSPRSIKDRLSPYFNRRSKVRARNCFLNLLKNVYRLDAFHAELKLENADEHWYDDDDDDEDPFVFRNIYDSEDEDGDEDNSDNEDESNHREGNVERFTGQRAVEGWFAAHGYNMDDMLEDDGDSDSDFEGEEEEEEEGEGEGEGLGEFGTPISSSIFFQQGDRRSST